MFRVNSTSKQLVRLNVVDGGKLQQVNLLPKNFVFTEQVTDQLKLLEKEGVIRVRDVKAVKGASASKPVVKPLINTKPEMEGKLDFVNADKVVKVQKKKK